MRSLAYLSDFAKSRLYDRSTLQINYLNVLLLLSRYSSEGEQLRWSRLAGIKPKERILQSRR